MKRQDIVNRLIKEGFSQKTLMNFTDKELTTLSSRVLGESEVMISKTDPMLKQKVDTAKKENKTIETYEGKGLKGGQKKIDKNHNGKIDSQDFKILRNKKSEVKEELKGNQEKIDKNKNGKIDSEDFKILKNKKSEVKKKKVNTKKKLEVSEWVENIAEQNYHSFTSKGEIMEMIKKRINEQEVGEKVTIGHNGIPEFMSSKSLLRSMDRGVEVKPAPVKKPVEKPNPVKDPFRTRPGKDRKTKAEMGGDVEVKPAPVKTPTEKPNPVKDPFRPRPGKDRKPKAKIAENKNRKK
jgi:hypothetical protein